MRGSELVGIKVCHNCGAQQTAVRFFCVDCNMKLGNTASKQEAELLEKKTQAMLEKSYNKSDPLHVNLLDKIIGFASLAGLLVAVVFSVIYRENLPVSVGPIMLMIYFLFIFCAVTALFPDILWSVEKSRLSRTYRNIEDIEPSDFYKIGRKISTYVFFIVTVGLLVYSLPRLANPPHVVFTDPIAVEFLG